MEPQTTGIFTGT